MDIAILGPLEVRVDGRVIPLGGPKQRALLAMLALHANEPVSRDRLIDALWGETPPPSVQQSLDTYLSRLRRALGGDRLVRGHGGYVLTLAPDELDVERFDRLVREARAAWSPADAEVLFRDALALWRGPALADVLYEPGFNGEAERLEDQRLGVVEDLFDAELARAGGAALVPELERLVHEHPLRERLLGQLMVALYRAGRQGDALAAMQAGRHRLSDELGLEPGPQLQELERRILRHEPTLDGEPRREGERRLPRRPWRAAAALAAVAAATGLLVASGGSERVPPPVGDAGGLLAIDSRSGTLLDPTRLRGQASAVAAGMGSLWVADSSGSTIARVDPATGDVVDRIRIGGEPGAVVVGGGVVWVATTIGGAIERIDPAIAARTQSVRLEGASASAIAVDRGALWVADATSRALVEVDAETGSVRRALPLDLRPSAVAVGRGLVWVAGYDEGTVEAIDPASGDAVTTARVGQGPTDVAVVGDAVWVANGLDSTVSRVDPRSGSVVTTIQVGSGPAALAVAGDSVWVANTYSGTVSRIDPRRNRVVATLRVGGRPAGLAALAEDVWVATTPGGDSHRGGTLELTTTAPFPSIDPGFHQSTTLLPRLAYDTLVTFQASSGPAGLRLVPDLALALPTPSRGGTTYVFRLRPGILYSDGRPVRAGDFRRAIERLFQSDSPGASRFDTVVGAEACTRRRARCDLSRGIVTNDDAGTVTFHLRSPDPDFLYKLTVVGFSAPVPPGTPDRDSGSRPVPGTGPYRIESSNRRQLRLVRNPFFREWSHAAQPDGAPDAVVWRFTSQEGAVRDVERGRADWVGALIPTPRLRALRIRHAGLLHENPSFDVGYIPLNTRRPPFDDVRVRRALNLAIDRAAIARMHGGTALATPTCQPLPPGFRGFRRYCPYTLHPRADGRWTGPDLRRARRLVTASGTRGMRIDVWGVTDLPFLDRRLPVHVASVLRSLGYRTILHLVPYNSLDTPARRRGLQLTVDGDWIPDYPAPSSYLPAFFSCHGGNNRKQYVCDAGLDRRMQRASAVELQDPARAARLWAEIDHELVDRAYWVPTVNVGIAELVSPRLRNYQYHPVWGFMAAQAWVR